MGREYKWCRRAMLNINHTLTIRSFLLLSAFHYVIVRTVCQLLVQMGLSERIKNPYICECSLPTLPKISNADVQSCILLAIGCVMEYFSFFCMLCFNILILEGVLKETRNCNKILGNFDKIVSRPCLCTWFTSSWVGSIWKTVQLKKILIILRKEKNQSSLNSAVKGYFSTN